MQETASEYQVGLGLALEEATKGDFIFSQSACLLKEGIQQQYSSGATCHSSNHEKEDVKKKFLLRNEDPGSLDNSTAGTKNTWNWKQYGKIFKKQSLLIV